MTPQKLIASIIFFVLFVLLAWYGYYNYMFYTAKWEKEAKAPTSSTPAPTMVQEKQKSECTTPCTITVRHNQSLWTDEQSVKFRKKGESEWIVLDGNKNVKIPSGDLDVVGYPDENKKIFVEAAYPY